MINLDLFKKKALKVKVLERDFDSVSIEVLVGNSKELIFNIIVNGSFIKDYNLDIDPTSKIKANNPNVYDYLQWDLKQAISIRVDEENLYLVKDWKISKNLFFIFYNHFLDINNVNENNLLYIYSHYHKLKYSKEQIMTIKEFKDLTQRFLLDLETTLRVYNGK